MAIHLKIATPQRMLFDEKVDMVVLRSISGDMGVLPGHEKRCAVLGYGPLRIFTSGKESGKLAVMGGFARISDNAVTVLSEDVEWPDEIDRNRAEAALTRAQQRLLQKESDVDMQRAELSLRRALVRIEVSSYPIIRK
jgi:F-type H+-transporting ATPase subunit epsilon